MKNDELIRKVSSKYIRIFPELLERFHSNKDMTMVKLISNEVFEESDENFINISKLNDEVKTILNN